MSIISTVPKGAAVEGINPNLLDNWYFQNPVNQRGQSSYSTDGAYTIDRWKLGGAIGTASFDSTGVLMSDKTLIGNWFETSRVISGATYTISALYSNGLITATGTLTIGAGTSGWQISYGTVLEPRTIAIRQVNANAFQFIVVGDNTNKVIAVKVELGDQQTLAHQENGVWVLNEIPDYEEELIKCQTSTADSTDTYANKTLATGQEIAPVENGPTSSRAYNAGDYFCWHGSLYKTSTAISVGDTLTESTNCYIVNVGNELNIRGKLLCTSRYVINSGTVVNHAPKQDCVFMILTYAVSPNGTYANGAYFGFVSMLNANYSHYSTLFTPASNPCSIAFEPGVIKITTSMAYVRVVVLEFPEL